MLTRACAFALMLLGLALAPGAGAQDSVGNDFVFAFQNNFRNQGELVLFITGEQDAQGTVQVPGIAFEIPFTLVAGEITEVEVPGEASALAFNATSSRGVRVQSDADVSVYALNRLQFSTDAFMVLPSDALGVEHVAMSYDGLAQFASDNLTSEIAIVATADDTLIEIIPAADAGPNTAGVPFTLTLDALEVYSLNTRVADLSGTIISSSKPVAVMGGHRCADVPSLERSPTGGRIGWCDHLTEMLPAVSTWGQSFLSIPLATRRNGSIVRVLAAENGVDVAVGTDPVVTLDRGQFLETVLTDFTSIEATGPVQVAQYAPGQAFDNVSADPFMMLIPPNEQFQQSYTFATPTDGFAANFVNVALPTQAVGSVVLDGAPVDPALFSVIGFSGFSGAQLALDTGTHTIAANQPLGVYVYGFNAYDSYGYPGGQALAELNPTTDSYPPNLGAVRQIGRTLIGAATDSEDLNANGVLDPNEDLNGNGLLDRRTEDADGNGQLDPGEDVNGNGALDRDRSVLTVELVPGADNLTLDVLGFVSGRSPLVNYRIDLIDPDLPGSGTLQARDLAGNVALFDVTVSNVPVLTEVHVISTVSGDRVSVDPASFTRAPTRLDVQVAETVVEWQFDSFTADQIEALAFDVVLVNPRAGEQRLVTQRLQLSYFNSPFGERITTELGPQSVLVSATSFDVEVNAAAANFGPDTVAEFQIDVSNVGTTSNAGTLVLVVEDAAGDEVTTLAPVAIGPLAAGTSIGVTTGFDTGSLLTGEYRLHVRLRDDQDAVVNEVFTPFSIVNSTAGLPVASVDVVVGLDAGGSFVAKDTYHTSDIVQLQARIRNDSSNALIDGALLRVMVQDPSGQGIFAQAVPITAQLGPGALTDVVLGVPLDSAMQGQYQVLASLVDDVTLATIGTGDGVFTVAQSLTLAVSGDVSAEFAELLLGDTQVCTDTLNSLVANALTDLPIVTGLVNIDAQGEVSSVTTQVDLNGRETLVTTRNETTGGVQGDFACLLQIVTADGSQTLGFAPFSVFDVIADPGPDQTAFVGETVQLDATASRETIDRPLSYRWRFVETPSGSQAALSDPVAAQPTFFVDEQGVYELELIANNGIDDSRPKLVRITVPNRLAVADAGPDQAVSVGDLVQLDSSGSSDLDADPLLFDWIVVQQPTGSTASLSDAAQPSPTLTIDVAGVYEIELVVNDGFADSLPDRVLLNVGNVAPVADAGGDFVALLGDVITLDGSGSTDVNGDNLSFRWFFESVPATSNAQLLNNGSVRPTFTIDTAGEYVVRLRVNDGLADSDPDFIVVTVGNAPPVADAGPDQPGTIGQTIVLDGGNSIDPNGDPLSYRWNLLARPTDSSALLQGPFTATPSFTVDAPGDYLAQLIVNDGQRDSAPDTVVVTFRNLRPVAEAIFDQPGELFTGDTVTVDGSESFDPEGADLTYSWELVERPEGSNAFLESADTQVPSFTLDRQGGYVAQLIVNDGQQDSEPATALVEAAQTCLDNLAIRPKYNKVQLTWSHNPDTDFVEIERSLALNGPYETIGQTDSTYSTYLDQTVTPNTLYYYRIRGVFPVQQLTQCRDVGEGLVCDGDFCGFVDEGAVSCGEGTLCEIVEFVPDSRDVLVDCGGPLRGDSIGNNSCPAEDRYCQAVCAECGDSIGCIEESGVDPALCEPPATAREACSTQVLATVPVYRVRMGTVPDVSGLSVEQAQSVLAGARFTLGEVGVERTTAVLPGRVVRQDVPRASVMPQGTAIDIVISTRGAQP